MIINHDHYRYRKKWKRAGKNKYNGAFYYSKEICKNIIPNVETDRNWITINIPEAGCDHAIVFIHNNKSVAGYQWLSKYNDLILVCGIPETVEKVSHLGHAIYLPLSVDVSYVEQFRLPENKRHGEAFVGRSAKRNYEGVSLPENIVFLEGMKRQDLLAEMARYEYVYAVGRTAIEARILGCKLKAYDPRFPDTERWKVFDNKDAAVELQKLINEIDRR